MTRPFPLVLVLAAAAVASLGSGVHGQAGRPAARQAPSIAFTDVTAAAGITFRHVNGAFGRKYLPETMGSGVAVLDVDGDGLQDLFFVNGKAWPGRQGPPSRPVLYRNTGGGRFADITRASGLDVEVYGMGATAGDYDNDGDIDLFVTALGGNRLFRNDGTGTFVDVTRQAGLTRPGFSASAAWQLAIPPRAAIRPLVAAASCSNASCVLTKPARVATRAWTILVCSSAISISAASMLSSTARTWVATS